MVMHLVPAAAGENSVASQITAMPTGARIELLLKNKQTMRGTSLLSQWFVKEVGPALLAAAVLLRGVGILPVSGHRGA